MITRRPKRIVAALFLAIPLIMAGCASTGGITPQSHGTDPASLDAGQAIRTAAQEAQWPASDWWRALQDPQLDAWVDAARAGNPSLAAAAARVRAARSMAGVAASRLAPQLDGSLSIQGKHWPDNLYYGPGPLSDQTTWNNIGELDLSYSLDLWGGKRNAAERALDQAHAQAADLRAAQLELEVNVVRAYVDLSMNYALLDTARATLAQQQRVLALTQRQLKAGLGTQLQVSQAETPLPESERHIDALEEAIALNRNQLAALAGKGPGAAEALARPRLALDHPVALPSTLPAELIGHRPDVVAARWNVAAQARGIDVAKAGFYPNIDLAASLGGYAAAGPFSQFLHARNGGWTLGPALSLPIFEGGRLRAELGAASAGYDAAVEQYNQTVVSALKDISDQLVRLRSLATQQRDAERAVQTARRNYELSLEGYRRGLTDYLNVPVAQTQLLRAQEDVDRIEAQRLTTHASLAAALGGGLAVPADGPRDAQMQPGQVGFRQAGANLREAAKLAAGASAVDALDSAGHVDTGAAGPARAVGTAPADHAAEAGTGGVVNAQHPATRPAAAPAPVRAAPEAR